MSEVNDKQKKLVKKFRLNVADVIKPHHDDQFLMRWLRARSWNLEAAEKMLRQSLLWRQEWEVDGSLKTWEQPEVVRLYAPIGSTGFDKDGAPIFIWLFGQMDIQGLMQSVGQKKLKMKLIQTIEKVLNSAIKNGIDQMVVIIDFENFSIKPYLSKAVAELAMTAVKMYEANYPETLKMAFAINAPKVFTILFNMIKPFLHENTLSKIHIFNNDSIKWKSALLKNIDPEHLPKQFGGSLTDPDGNPKCITMVNQGGKVPEHDRKALAQQDLLKSYTAVVINGRDKLNLDFKITQAGSLLRWDFFLEANDIRFGITFKTRNGETHTAREQKQVGNYQENECGCLECKTPGTYTVTFDNSYSVFNGKKLFYNIVVSPPLA